jgi:hypothetical protein
MYGTVARMKMKPEARRITFDSGHREHATPQGLPGRDHHKMDNNPRSDQWRVLCDKASYQANASDPEMNKEYEQYRALLDADPEWNDGEVIHQFWVK